MTFDHLVYATPTLDASVRHVAELTGVQPVEGGRHITLGTRNYLLGFGDSRYLEIIGPDPEQPAPAQPRPLGIDNLTEPRLVAWAVRVHDIESCVAQALELGYDPGPVKSMSRRTPAGELLTWRVTNRHDAVVPFLIDWGNTPHPARDLPVVPLTAFYARHPAPAERLRRLAAIGAELDVRQGNPGLTAVIGDVTLT
jgi:hypothetical protein